MEGDTFRWRIISGDCCGEWNIEVRIPTIDIPADYDEHTYCRDEWNNATRLGVVK